MRIDPLVPEETRPAGERVRTVAVAGLVDSVLADVNAELTRRGVALRFSRVGTELVVEELASASSG